MLTALITIDIYTVTIVLNEYSYIIKMYYLTKLCFYAILIMSLLFISIDGQQCLPDGSPCMKFVLAESCCSKCDTEHGICGSGGDVFI